MKMTRRITLSALAGLGLLASPLVLAGGPADDGGPNLVRALSVLASGPDLAVERRGARVVVRDSARQEVVLVATGRYVMLGDPDADPAEQRRGTRVVRGADKRELYVASTTRLGARSAIFPAGRLLDEGLHVLAFDNDDVYVADGEGGLVYSASTDDAGVLTERESADYGCGCERVTDADGRSLVRPLTK